MRRTVDKSFTAKFEAAPVHAESFATFFEETLDRDIAKCPRDVRSAIANVLRVHNPRTYGDFMRAFQHPDIVSLTKELGEIKCNVMLSAIWLFSHRVYDFLRNKDPSLPRNGYRPEEVPAMSRAERRQLDQELAQSFALLESAMKEILGVDPGDL